MREKSSVEIAEFPPDALEYLCTLVNGVTGPSLPDFREMKSFEFVSPVEDHLFEKMGAFVAGPTRDHFSSNSLRSFWKEWEIAVALKTGASSGSNWGWFLCTLLPWKGRSSVGMEIWSSGRDVA